MPVLVYKFVILFATLSAVNGLINDRKLEGTKHSKDCPLWFHYNSSLQDCQCPTLSSTMFTCNGQDVSVSSDHITTYDESKGIVSLSYTKICQFLYYKFNESTPLPKNISQLNNLTCGPLNRKGYLCRDCIDGYGLTVNLIACNDKCYKCTMRHSHGVAIYIIVETVPLTLFYIFILVFRINVVSAPMTCFILYSQIVTIAVHIIGNARHELLFGQVVYTEAGELRTVSKIFLTLYGVFNLDFFRHILPPFCISTELTPLQRLYLGYISAFYPLILIFLTWFCIKLHDNNFKSLVILWRPFHRCFVQARKGWTTRNDLIDVFASFFLLSYCKIVYQTTLVLGTTLRFDYSLRAVYLSESYVHNADISIQISSALYIVSATFSLLISCIFGVFPVLMLVLFPVQSFRRALSKCKLHRLTVVIFVEKFHACYRDGLDDGRDMRSFSGLYFLLRVIGVTGALVIYDLFHFEQWFVRGTVFSIASLVIALCRPYKERVNNISDTLLLFNVAIICYILSSDTKTKFFVPIMQALILIPFIVFGLLVAFRIARKIYKRHLYLCYPKEVEANITESEQQQLIQPVLT